MSNSIKLILLALFFISLAVPIVNAGQEEGYLKDCLWSFNDSSFSNWNSSTGTGVFLKVNNSNQAFSGNPVINYYTSQSPRPYFNITGNYPSMNSTMPMINIDSGKDAWIYIKCNVKFGQYQINSFGFRLFSDQWQGTAYTSDFNLSKDAVNALQGQAIYNFGGATINGNSNNVPYISSPMAWSSSSSMIDYVKIGSSIEYNYSDQYTFYQGEPELAAERIDPYSDGVLIQKVNLKGYPSGFSRAATSFHYSNGGSLFWNGELGVFYINSSVDFRKFFSPKLNSDKIMISIKDIPSNQIIYNNLSCFYTAGCATMNNYSTITYILPFTNPYSFDLNDKYTISVRQFYPSSAPFGDLGAWNGPGGQNSIGKTLELGVGSLTNDFNVTDFNAGQTSNITLQYTFTENHTIYPYIMGEVYLRKTDSWDRGLLMGYMGIAGDNQKYLVFGETRPLVQYNPGTKKLELNLSQVLFALGKEVYPNEFALNISIYRMLPSGNKQIVENYPITLNDTFFSSIGISNISGTGIRHSFILPLKNSYASGEYKLDITSTPIFPAHKFYNRPIADLSGEVSLLSGDLLYAYDKNLNFSIINKNDKKSLGIINPSFDDRKYQITTFTSSSNFTSILSNNTMTSNPFYTLLSLFSTKDINVSSAASISNSNWPAENVTYIDNLTVNLTDISVGLEPLDSAQIKFNLNIIGTNYINFPLTCSNISVPLTCANQSFLTNPPLLRCNWNSSAASIKCQDCPTEKPISCSFYNEMYSCNLMSCGIDKLFGVSQVCGWDSFSNQCRNKIFTGTDYCLYDSNYTAQDCAADQKYRNITFITTGRNSSGGLDSDCSGNKTYQVYCPNYVELPFFSFINIVLCLSVILIGYLFLKRKI